MRIDAQYVIDGLLAMGLLLNALAIRHLTEAMGHVIGITDSQRGISEVMMEADAAIIRRLTDLEKEEKI